MAKQPPETNPFLQDFSFVAYWKLDLGEEEIVQGEGTQTSAKSYLIDKEEKVSLFTDVIFNWYKDLPSSAQVMFMYIACHIGWAADAVELQEEKYCKDAGISSKTFYTAKAALTNRLIIPKVSRANMYWVNPAYLFKGNRVKSFPRAAKPQNTNPLRTLKE